MKTELNILKIDKIKELKHNVYVVKETSKKNKGDTYLLKTKISKQEIKLLRNCFPKINQQKFKVLRLPIAHRTGKNDQLWVMMDYFKGDIIKWDEKRTECAGGRNISVEYVDILSMILSDLKSIDTKIFLGILPEIESTLWYSKILEKLNRLYELKLFLRNYYQDACAVIKPGLPTESKKDLILTNGDFQFRNFIKLQKNKMAVIDWSKSGHNTPNIEPLEFAVMYQWTLMWNNLTWQNSYIKKVKSKFNISNRRLRYALVIKSINQAHLWRGSPELARIQVNNCVRAINREF